MYNQPILQMKQIGAYAPPFYGALTLSVTLQGSHLPGKSGRVRELIWFGKVREFCWWSGNFGSLRTKTAFFVYFQGKVATR